MLGKENNQREDCHIEILSAINHGSNNMNLLYQKFDELILVRKEVIREVAALTETIRGKSDMYHVKDSSAFDGLGPLCPSLIIDKITSPVQVMKNDITMENGKVIEIVHCERRDGCDIETYRYTKK